MKVLVIGASGLVGSYILKLSPKEWDVTGTANSQQDGKYVHLDIRDGEKVLELISKVSPELVFLPAGLTHVDYCEEHPEESREINVGGVRNVVEGIKKLNNGAKLIFFSTDYIFDGKRGSYSEEDPPNPINEYGRQKLEAEKIVLTLDKGLVIRTAGIYGWSPTQINFVARLIKNNRNGQVAKIPNDQINCPTYAKNLIEIIFELEKKDKAGIFNVVGKDALDRFSFSKIIAEIFNLSEKLLIPVSTDYLAQKAKRPLNTSLSIEKVKKAIPTPVLGVKEGLVDMRKDDPALS